MLKDYSPGPEADDEESFVDNVALSGVEDSSSEDMGNTNFRAARNDNQGYYNARVQELKKEQDYSGVEVRPWNYFDQNDSKVHQTTETEGKLFTDAVSFMASSEEWEQVFNKNFYSALNFNYHGGPDVAQGNNPLMNEGNSILVNCGCLENQETDVCKTNDDDLKVQMELIEDDQCDFPVMQWSEQQCIVDDNQHKADIGRREGGGIRYSYEETNDANDTNLIGCHGEFERLKRLEQNVERIWKLFEVVQLKPDKVIERLIGQVDMVEHGAEFFFKLCRIIELLTVENEILKEMLEISNILNSIPDNTRSVSSEHSGEVLDHRNVNSSSVSPPSRHKRNSEELFRDDATVIQLYVSDEDDDNRPCTVIQFDSKLPKPGVNKEQHQDQGTDSSDGSQDDKKHKYEAIKPFAKLINKLKMAMMFSRKEDDKEDCKQEDCKALNSSLSSGDLVEALNQSLSSEDSGEALKQSHSSEHQGEVLNSSLDSENSGVVFNSSLSSEHSGEVLNSSLDSENSGEVFNSSLSSEDAGEVLDHLNVHSSSILQPSQQKRNSEKLFRGDATIIYLKGSNNDDDNRPCTVLKLASKLPKPGVKKDHEKDQGTDSSDDSQDDKKHKCEDNRERSGQEIKPFAKLKTKLKMAMKFSRIEDEKENFKKENCNIGDYESENRKNEGCKHEDRKHEERKHEDRKQEGRKHEDRKHEERKHEDRKHEGGEQENRQHEGREDENRNHEGRRQDDLNHEDLELVDRQNVNIKPDVCNDINCKQENCQRNNENQCSGQDEVDANSQENPNTNTSSSPGLAC